jgi:TonB-linked SusC/RagA family outer membrane protein
MPKLRFLLIVMVLSCVTVPAIAEKNRLFYDFQTGKLSGKVLNEAGEPLNGASVTIKGTGQSVLTDEKGFFVLENSKPSIVLVVSYVGMQDKEISVTGNSLSTNIVLQQSFGTMSDVVVVGYGTQKKSELTGSVSTVKGDVIKRSPAVNLSNALAGNVTGIIANNRSGEPGNDGSSILVRGASTLNDNSPLIVIDGVPDRGNIGRLDPNEVESVTILKDGAAAIYGARAANGVILVTTKRGSSGKPKIDYNFNQGFVTLTRTIKLVNAGRYAELQNEMLRNEGRPEQFTQEEIQKFKDGSDPFNYPNTDWAKETLKPVSYQSRHNVSVSGGTSAVKYFLTGGATNQEAMYRNSGTNFKQYNFRSNIDVNITDNFRVYLDVAGRQENSTNNIFGGSLFSDILRNPPVFRARNPDGTIPEVLFGRTPLLMTSNEPGYNKSRNEVFNSTLGFNYKIPFLTGLYVEGYAAVDKFNTAGKSWQQPYTIYDYNETTGQSTPRQVGTVQRPSLSESFSRSSSLLLNARLGYKTSFKGHNLAAFAMYEQQEVFSNLLQASRINFLGSALDELFAGSASPNDRNNNGSSSQTARQSYLGRFNYDYEGKYLFTFNLRADGSMNFAKDKRFGYFPGASIGWVISKESFFDRLSSTVSMLKIRASYAKLGNDRVPPFQYLATYGYGRALTFGNGLELPTMFANVVPNPNITWEVDHGYNVGLEGGLWNNKFEFELDLFKNNRTGILYPRNLAVPAYTGLSLPNENIGKVDRQGIEMVLRYNNKIGEINYRISGNLSYTKNKVVEIFEAESVPEWQKATGLPLGSGLYYKALGIIQSEEELTKYPIIPGQRPGDIRYADTNEDGIINGLDRVRVDLNSTPRLLYGFTLGANYKNFDLNMLFQGQAMVRQYVFTNTAVSFGIPEVIADQRWVPGKTDATYPRMVTAPYGSTFGLGYENTMFLKNAAFLRLKTLELGYTLPAALVRRAGISNLRVYASGFNLFTIDKLKFMDPESTESQGYFYPQQRIFNLGLALSL